MHDIRLQQALTPGEQIWWSGRPAQGLRLSGHDIFLIPFSVLWGGFAIFWEFMAIRQTGGSPEGIPFVLFGAAFVVIGLFMIVGRFFVDAWLRARMSYGVTDRRIIIARRGRLSVLSLKSAPDATLSEGRDGRSTIRFGPARSLFGTGAAQMGFAIWIPSLDPTLQFLHIENARRVFDDIQRRMATSA